MFDKSQLPDIIEREKAFELHKAWEAANDATYEVDQDDAEAVRVTNARNAEAEAAKDACGVALETDADGNAVRCVICGAPIVEGDETLFDYSTGEHVLRVAIGLPPRPSEHQEAAE